MQPSNLGRGNFSQGANIAHTQSTPRARAHRPLPGPQLQCKCKANLTLSNVKSINKRTEFANISLAKMGRRHCCCLMGSTSRHSTSRHSTSRGACAASSIGTLNTRLSLCQPSRHDAIDAVSGIRMSPAFFTNKWFHDVVHFGKERLCLRKVQVHSTTNLAR